MKKLLSLTLALLMVFSLATVALAVDENVDGTYNDEQTITITKSYELVGDGTSPAETFKVMQVGKGTCDNVDVTSVPDLTSISGVEFTAGAAGSDEKTGTFTITLPTYTKVGVYTYTLQETAGNTQGVTYRTDTMTLVVSVIEQDGLVRVAAVHTESEGGEKSDTFSENTYTANTLSITKTVDGNFADTYKEFSFEVTFTAESGKSWVNNITVDCPNIQTEVEGNTYEFTLSHGDTITFSNVPSGVSYEITESYEDYTPNYTDGTVTGTMEGEAVSYTFVNTKEGPVDTGITLDSVPFILILSVCAAAVVLFVIKRRNTVEF